MLEIDALTTHDGALDGVALAAATGELVHLVGDGQSGVATLLAAVAGTTPATGTVRVGGTPLDARLHRRARAVAWVGPTTTLAPGLTVAEHLALAARRDRWRGLGRPFAGRFRGTAEARLAVLGTGLESRLDTPAGALAPGDRRVLAITMAAWTPPQVLLLDEPLAGLAPADADRVLRVVVALVRGSGPATLIGTREADPVVRIADRVVLLHRGTVLDVLTGPARRRAGAVVARLDDARARELLDESAAEILAAQYV
jgi:putative ABC transport system ATP-binding protein